jgi:hypothetical protein
VNGINGHYRLFANLRNNWVNEAIDALAFAVAALALETTLIPDPESETHSVMMSG